MAVAGSGLFVPTFRDALKQVIVLDLDLTTHLGALFTNSITVTTPGTFSTATAYGVAPFNANEIPNGGGYTTGGQALAGTSVTESPTGTIMWDATDPAWTSSTITNARCILWYANALAGKNAIALVNFGADYSTVSGTFTIQLPSAGIFAWDVTP